MKRQTLTIEHCLYLLAFLLALGVRLLRLGAAPLSEVEAGWALQALGLSRGETILLGTQPLYILFTSLFFALLGSGNGLARLFPALAGSALVFVPLLWSRSFRRFRVAALIAAFGLALDPGLVAASRLAGGPVPAVTFVLLALGFALCQSAAWTGVFGGLALLTGVPVVPGLLGLALTWGAAEWLKSLGVMAPLPDGDNGSFTDRFPAGFHTQDGSFWRGDDPAGRHISTARASGYRFAGGYLHGLLARLGEAIRRIGLPFSGRAGLVPAAGVVFWDCWSRARLGDARAGQPAPQPVGWSLRCSWR